MINLIAAMSQNYQIGLNNQMPWHLPEDLTYFKETTMHHTVLMGRKTYESIGHPLPNRRNIVLTHNQDFSSEGIEVIHTFEEALALCNTLSEVFIIGGGEIYKAFIPYADRLYLTLIDQVITGDTSFPEFQHNFKCTSSVPGQACPPDLTYHFTLWERL